MNRILLVVALQLSAVIAWAAPAGEVTHLSGILSVKKSDGSTKILSVKSAVEEGDTLVTEAITYARLKFKDGGEAVLRPNTQLMIRNYRFEEARPEGDGVFLSLFKGGLRTVTGLIGKRSRTKVAVETPTATIGIRGTHFGALFCKRDCDDVPTVSGMPPVDGLHVDVAAGAVSLTNAAGTVEFTAGQFAHIADANTLPELVPAERGIRVTMPGSIAANRGGDGIGTASALECSVR